MPDLVAQKVQQVPGQLHCSVPKHLEMLVTLQIEGEEVDLECPVDDDSQGQLGG